jgi:hypothetical protein
MTRLLSVHAAGSAHNGRLSETPFQDLSKVTGTMVVINRTFGYDSRAAA